MIFCKVIHMHASDINIGFYSFVQISMNVCLEQMVVLNYATTQLEATHAHVTLATHLIQTTKHAVVCVRMR